MLLLVLLALAFTVGLLLGGKPHHLAEVHLRSSALVLGALAIQILVFSSWWQRQFAPSWGALLYPVSMLLLLVVVWQNRRTPGLPILGVGLLLNAAVIVANGGHMPASPQALEIAGLADTLTALSSGETANSMIMTPSTPLWFLGDLLAVPASWPLSNVFSIGDTLITIGAIWFLMASMRVLDSRYRPVI